MAVNLIVAPPYDPKLAAFYGQLVDIVYDMYDKDPNNQTPSPPAQLPGNYRFVAWVQMQDFFIWESPYTFYGLIAQNPSGENDYVLAIRGTSAGLQQYQCRLRLLPDLSDLAGHVSAPAGTMPGWHGGAVRITRSGRFIR
jgi:hypothetical protein